MKRVFLIALILFVQPAFSQSALQVIRGRITDISNALPIPGVKVSITNTDTSIYTDSSGYFKLEGIQVGTYSLQFNKENYHLRTIQDLKVISGKETVLDVQLQRQTLTLSTITIEAEDNLTNSVEITVEQSQKYAAAFYDPARVITSFPGAVNSDDQANHLVVRGNSPNSLQWKLEGVEIVNPNHLDNAGTFSDKASVNGGGVNILSAQLLNNSRFHFAPYDATHGNALAGIFDMRLRKGNNEKREHTFQVSLLGTDIATEGPISKKTGSSYLVNYRYSTIGLLSFMGVNFGAEKISFQDLAFNVSLPQKNNSSVTVFGMAGNSFNNFSGIKDSSERRIQKDFQEINYESEMAALGMTYKASTGEKSFINFSLCGSAKRTFRESINLEKIHLAIFPEEDNLTQSRISSHLSFQYLLKNSGILNTGFYFTDYKYVQNLNFNKKATVDYGLRFQLIQPYMNYQKQVNEYFRAELGLHLSCYENAGLSYSPEPRMFLSFKLKEKQFLHISSGLYSQLQVVNVYFAGLALPGGQVTYPNEGLEPTRSFFSSINHTTRLKNITLKNELYFQYLFNVPIEGDRQSSFSTLNIFNETAPPSLVNKGTGKNMGYEFSIRKKITDYYFLFTASLYESTYTGSDSIERTTRYNGNYSGGLTTGKEWNRHRNNKLRVFSIDMRSVYRGGFREGLIDAANSENGQTVFDDYNYPVKLKDYLRFDLRLSLKKDKIKSTRTIALDIQNVTNRQNVSFHYFDAAQRKTIQKYQLGIIPILSYKVHF